MDNDGLADLVGDLRDLREHYGLAAVSVVLRGDDTVVVSVGEDDQLRISDEAGRSVGFQLP